MKIKKISRIGKRSTYCMNVEKYHNFLVPLKNGKHFVSRNCWGINTPSRWGCQAPFSNVTLDLLVPNDMKEVHPNIGGKEMPFTYADCQEAMDRFNTIFFEVFEEGDSIGNIFQYPILTVNVTPDFRWDHPVTEKLFKLDAKYGSFYFTNMVNSDMKPEDLRSMCATKDTLIEVELEEDIVEHEGKYYTLEQAVKKGLVVLDETHTNFVCVTDQSDVKSETKC